VPVTGVTPGPRRLGRRPVLDGLRGIAVLLVISEHAGLVKNGFMGVDVFFVLSGFLITTLLCEEWERFGHISIRSFYIRRARRLLPGIGLMAILAVGIDLLAYQLTGWGLGLKLASTLGFANNWVATLSLDHGRALGAINPTWSLAQEEQFYLLWPIALIVLLKLGVKPVQILAMLVALTAALLLCEPTIAAHLAGYDPYYSPVDRAAELLLGCAGSILWRHRIVWLPEAATDGQRLSAPVALMVDLILAGLTFAFAWLYLEVNPVDPRWVFLGAAAVALPCLLLLVQVPRSLLGRLMSLAPLCVIGRLSYCLYLIHLLVRNVLLHYFPGIVNPWEVAGLTVSVSLVTAAFSYRYIETPIRLGQWPLGLGHLTGLPRRAGNRPARAPKSTSPHATPRPIRSSA
jgi:peptidoglycan/LPS O-acetylase OafA/YrhL